MAWTLLLVLTVTWLLAMVGDLGEPWRWLLPATIALLLLYRFVRSAAGR